MAQAARKLETTVAAPATVAAEPAVERAPAARSVSAADLAHASPALALQARVEGAVAAQAVADQKWSYRKTFGFLMLVNGAFWLTAAFLVAKIFF